MSSTVRRAAGTPLSEEAKEQLRRLASMPDSEINFTESPERFHDAQPDLPPEEHTVTLCVDAEVAAWLQTAARENPVSINLLLKRAAHRSKRPSGDGPSVLDKAS